MAEVTTSNGSTLGRRGRRIRQPGEQPAISPANPTSAQVDVPTATPAGSTKASVSNTTGPQLSLHYSYSVVVSFQIELRHLANNLPKGLELESRKSSLYVDLTVTHFLRSKLCGIPLIPAFNTLTLSTAVRSRTDASKKGRFVYVRCISSKCAAWHMKNRLRAESKLVEIRCRDKTAAGAKLPAVDFHWKSGEASNHLNVKALAPVRDVQNHAKTKWLFEHQSEFAMLNPKRVSAKSPEGLVMFQGHPDVNCDVYDVSQAGFKCGTKRLFGNEFSKALRRRPASVFLICDGVKRFSKAESVDQRG